MVYRSGRHKYGQKVTAIVPGLDRAANADISGPRFSVIIPTYNRDRFIGESILSALEQRYPAEEILVVDDGSTDKTRQVVHGIPSGSTVHYYYQKNQGPAGARNYGASRAKGTWLAFLDADDVWRPDKLFTQADHVRKYSEVVMFWGDVDYMDAAGKPREPMDWNDHLAPLMFNHPVCPTPSTVIIRKDIFTRLGGFNPLMRCYEDGEFFMRVAAQFPIYFIDQILATYRCHENQLHRNVRDRATSWPYMYELLAELWRGEPAKQAILYKVSAANHTHVGKHYLRSGDYREARRHFRISFELEPLLWRNLRRWGLSYLPGIRKIYRRAKSHAVGV
jgi:glycosyltransferase involved in cell wall biosynthesis